MERNGRLIWVECDWWSQWSQLRKETRIKESLTDGLGHGFVVAECELEPASLRLVLMLLLIFLSMF